LAAETASALVFMRRFLLFPTPSTELDEVFTGKGESVILGPLRDYVQNEPFGCRPAPTFKCGPHPLRLRYAMSGFEDIVIKNKA
jgi:hypothetical protein